MSEAQPGDEPRQLITEFRLTPSVTAQLAVASTVGFVLSVALFAAVFEAIHGTALEPLSISVTDPSDLFVWIAALVAVLIAVVVPHELVHGLFMTRYGGRPEYGVGVSHFVLPYAYARTEGTEYTRNQMLVVLLSPLVVLSIVGLVLLVFVPSPLVVLALAANAAGSVGDLWMAALLLRHPSSVRVGELPDPTAQGIGIYGSVNRRDGTGVVRLWSPFWKGGAATFAVVLTGLFALVVGSLATGSGTVVLGDPDGRWFLFRHELVSNGRGAVLEIGFPLLIVLSVLGGAVSTALSVAVGRLE